MGKELARKLRRNATFGEMDFWRLTYSLRRPGWPFRRQHQIGSYYVDFVCLKAALVVEIDGDTHYSELAQSNDAARDDYLRGRGFTVMRFTNAEVSSNREGVFQVVSAYLDNLPLSPPPQPSPQGGGSRIGARIRIRDGKARAFRGALPLSPPPQPSPQGGGSQIEFAQRIEDTE